MKELIKTYLGDIIREIASDFKGEVLVEIPENKEHGSYASSVAFSLSKILKRSPQAVAEELVKKLNSQKIKDFSKIESINGFVNFFLSEECMHHQLKEILEQKNKYGWAGNSPLLKLRRTRKINIEFISGNPTGPLTIGNGRGGFYGDVLANILETQGYKVTREYYVNDRGEQIVALGRSIKLAQKEGPTSRDFEVGPPNQDNLYRGEYIKELAKQIDEKLNTEEAGQKAVELILKTYIKPALKRLKVNFDVWFSEKTLYTSNYQKALNRLMASDFVYEKDGATWMKTSELGDNEDRVLIKKDRNETYFLSDILYHFDKFNIRKFSKAIDIWGADHHGYAPRLKAALKVLGIPEENLDIVISQLVRLVKKGGQEMKISKRAGTFITLDDLIKEVGLDAARFFFLMYSLNTHMNFDLSLAKERSQKNPVHYVQYAHARISSILRKAKISQFQVLSSKFIALKTKAELNLIRKLVEYPEILSDIAESYEVHRLPRYALELAREFHNFYEKERVISEDKNLTNARLALVLAVKIVLRNALNLMGIKAPDKM